MRFADKLIELIDDDIASLSRDMSREGYDVCLCTLQMVKQYIKALQRSATNTEQFENCGTNDAEPKRDLEIVVNEACLNCELDCVEAVRCHDCKHYEEAKNGCNGFCKEWDTSTYTWDYCSRGERKDEVENG